MQNSLQDGEENLLTLLQGFLRGSKKHVDALSFATFLSLADDDRSIILCLFFRPGVDMPKPDDMLLDIEIADPAVEAALTVLTVSEETAILVRAETEALASETRQILEANLALMVTATSSQKAAQAAVALARHWHL